MKLSRLIILLSIGLLLGITQFSYAVAPNKALIEKEAVANEDVKPSETFTKKELRKQKRVEKREKRLAKWTAKLKKKMAAVDFNDPVKKWMWFWIFGWGAGIVLWIVAGSVAVGSAGTGNVGGVLGGGLIGLLATLVTLFGTVALIIWLVKMLG